jgi:minor extracellular serine protease Vpr
MRKSVHVALLLVGVFAVSAAAWEMAPQAAAKVDPRLLLLYKDPARVAYGLGKTITIQGPSIDQAVVPVVAKTTATDIALERCGALVGTRLGDIVTLRIPVDRLEELATLSEVEAIEASYKMYNLLDVSVPECGGHDVHTGSPPYFGTGVIVGLLDSGIDPYHGDFGDNFGNPRTIWIWDQWDQNGPPPGGYTYGREWTKSQIAAGQCTMNDPGAHGTHCSGIAAGDGAASNSGYMGMAPDAKIMMVANLADDIFTYGYAPPWYSQPYTYGSLDGLAWLQSKAQSEGMPMVVSWSQGVTMGPHDGSTLFETGVNNFIQQYDVPVVIAAGNEGYSDLHAQGTVTTGTPLVISFSTGQAGDPLNGDVPFEMWYKAGDQMAIEIRDPTGQWGPQYGPNETTWPGYVAGNGDTVWVYSTSSHPVNGKGYFLLDLWNYGQGVGQGTWQIRISAANGLPQGGLADLWFERNRTVWWTDHVSQQTTLGMPGTCTQGICVASYNTKLQWQGYDGQWWQINETVGDISGFSSRGPRADGYQKPDISAPGQIIASALASGAAQQYMQQQPGIVDPDGVHVLFQGTSMACPHVAGTVALMLEKDPNLSYTQIKQHLVNTARTDQYTGGVWNNEFGWGKLDAKGAVDAIGGGGGDVVDLIYDDGDPYSGYYWSSAGSGSGVRMTPPQYPATILRLSYYITSLDAGGTGGNGSFSARVYDFTGNPGSQLLSANVTPPATGWVQVDVSSQNVSVTREFVAAMIYDGVNTPAYGYDQSDNGRGWDYSGGWSQWPETYFMRATVQTGTAVELASFTASALEGAVRLEWEVADQTDHAGFNVYRSDMPDPHGMELLTSELIQADSYLDGTVLPGRAYYYWLEDVDVYGLGNVHGPVEVTTVGGPATVWLAAPRPNPTSGPVLVRFCVPRPGEASVALYNMAGRKVASLAETRRVSAGWQEVRWEPDEGVLAAGRYLCKLSFEGAEASKPIVVVR